MHIASINKLAVALGSKPCQKNKNSHITSANLQVKTMQINLWICASIENLQFSSFTHTEFKTMSTFSYSEIKYVLIGVLGWTRSITWSMGFKFGLLLAWNREFKKVLVEETESLLTIMWLTNNNNPLPLILILAYDCRKMLKNLWQVTMKYIYRKAKKGCEFLN